MVQDLLFETAELGARLEAEFVTETPSTLLKGTEGIGLTLTAIQGDQE